MPEAEEAMHFGKPSYRLRNKIFAVLHPAECCMVLKLSPEDQALFTALPDGAFFSVPGKWGAQGWTNVQLDLVTDALLPEGLKSAWCDVAGKKLIGQYFPERLAL